MRRIGITVAVVLTTAAAAQQNRPSTVPGSPAGFDFPMSMEAVQAAPKNHHVLYEDAHVRLLEVTLWPGDRENMHGHAYPSVFAFDAVQPAMVNDHLPGIGGPPKFGNATRAKGVPAYPRCETLGPQTPHAAMVTQDFPQHFYRMEFKRLDGDRGFAANWRAWYPQTATTRALFGNDHLRLIEVLVRPGETARIAASEHSAVLAFDTPEPNTRDGPSAKIAVTGASAATLQPLQHSAPAVTWNYPTCDAVGPNATYRVSNTGALPIHYYRIEFNWVDGDRFPQTWRAHFPNIAKGPPAAPSS